MAKKNSAVLWTVEQTLGDNNATKKTNKERARHNVGINFEPTAGENHDQPPTPSGNTLSFVDKIDEAADGTLTYTRKNVTVDESIDSTSDHPVRNSAIATALSNLKTFYATQSTTFAQLKTAYDAGQTLVFINDGHAYQLDWVNKLNNTPVTFEFSNPYLSLTQEDRNEGKVYDKFLRLGAWSCTSSSGWSQAITPQNVVCQDYADYRVGALQTSDVAIATGDKLVISDSSNHGKGVRSGIAFDTTASETSFLNQRGAWNTALPTYTESTDPLASNYWDTLSGTKFYTIKSSPTPASDNTSPEEGNIFALTGELDRGSGNKYKVQLAMGDKLYYRHTTGTAGTTWSDWITLNEYSAGTDLKLTGTTFSVDTTSTIDNHSSRSFVLGPNNAITYSDDSFTGGTLNKIGGMNSSFAFGTSNIIGAVTASENIGTGNTAFGQSNTIVHGRFNIILGSANTINKGNSPYQGNDPYNNIIIGENNTISGNSSAVYSHDTILIGNSLTWSEPNYHPLVLGVFNTDSWRYKNKNLIPLRITGGGTIDSPKNVEVMYSDGLIWSNSGFEVSEDTDNGYSTYRTHIYKTLDSSFNVNGTGVYSKWTHTDVISSSRILDYAETGHLANTFISVSSAKTDSNAKTAENPTGLVNITSVANQILKRIPSGQHDPSDKTCVPIIEFSSTTAGGNVGLTMGNPALPAWNTKEAKSTDNIALSWLQVYGNRNADGDDGGDILPSANSVPLGNLEVGKIAVKFYKETELTEQNPLVPGQKVGDISFVVGDPTTNDHGFYVYDYYKAPGESTETPQTHKTSYINDGYHFCMLMTVTPSSFDPTTHMMTTPGSFCVLN